MKLNGVGLYSTEHHVFTPFIEESSTIVQVIELVKKGEIKNIPLVQKFIIYSKSCLLSSLVVNVASWSLVSARPDFITNEISLDLLIYKDLNIDEGIKLLAESWDVTARSLVETILIFCPIKDKVQ
ncbi:MAG: hypothetical protein NTY12_04785 [Candidatus Falkowbacteria bacterium]|nr:hypothetical protein [Candidatus Falkowbacteria bacterium]